MGFRWMPGRAGVVLFLFAAVGCQSAQPGLGNRLIAHAAMIDFAGLKPTANLPDLDVKAGVPRGWDAQPVQSNALFTHAQWRSPTRSTAVGVAHINLPLPVSAKTLIWFGKSQYEKHADDAGKNGTGLLDEWTDAIGREWFDAQNSKYRVKGYAVTKGFDAWVVYTGYRRRGTPRPAEIGLAFRAMDTVVPNPIAGK